VVPTSYLTVLSLDFVVFIKSQPIKESVLASVLSASLYHLSIILYILAIFIVFDLTT